MRAIAFLLLLAVLPTVEITEQVEHVVAHLFSGEPADHSAHHDDDVDDEHGCTGLVHLCLCHHAQVTAAAELSVQNVIWLPETVAAATPPMLIDLSDEEPEQRPPIA